MMQDSPDDRHPKTISVSPAHLQYQNKYKTNDHFMQAIINEIYHRFRLLPLPEMSQLRG